MKKFKSFVNLDEINRISFRNDINGLRAIAVLSVVLYHAEIPFFSGGWLGVDIFFVISGYLISNIIISELNQGEFSLKRFYLRRIKRILPALFSTIFLSLPLAYWLLTPKALIQFTNSVTSSVFFYSNLYFKNLDFYNAPPTKVMPLLHTWTLAIEEQFYLIFPIVCIVIYKRGKNVLAIFLSLLFLFSIYINSTTADLAKFYELQYRIWELVLGSLVMIARFKFTLKHFEKIGIFLVFFGLFYFDDSMLTLNSIEPKIIITFGTALILISDHTSKINSLLGSKYFTIIGLSSYSMYLLHQPLFAFCRIYFYKVSFQKNLITDIFLILFLVVLSYLSWRFVETYFQNTSFKTLALALLIGLAIFLLFIFLTLQTDGFPNRYSHVPETVLFYSNNINVYPETFDNNLYNYKNKNCNNKILEKKYCIWYNNLSDKTIYLVGDSHTNTLSVSFLKDFNELNNDYNLVFLSGRTGRCLLSQQSDTVGYVEECEDVFFTNFLDIVDKNDYVVAFGRFNNWLDIKDISEIKCDNCDYVDVFKNRLTKLAEKSKRLIIIEPVPTYNFSIAESYLYKRSAWGTPISQDLEIWKEKVLFTNSVLKNLSSDNIKRIETIPIFCETSVQKKCFASTESELFYSDSNHLTLTGARLITEAVEKEIENK